MILKKIKSGAVKIFSAIDINDGIIATLVITAFNKDEKLNNTSSYLYASDFILKKELIANQEFISQFMGSVYKFAPHFFPDAKVVALLAPGKKLGKCINDMIQINGELLC